MGSNRAKGVTVHSLDQLRMYARSRTIADGESDIIKRVHLDRWSPWHTVQVSLRKGATHGRCDLQRFDTYAMERKRHCGMHMQPSSRRDGAGARVKKRSYVL